MEALHPIQVVARRTGLSADVIRAWERRYEAVLPKRSSTSRRLYSDEDVQRLTLLRQITQLGRRIGDVARLPVEDLKALLELDATPSEASTISPPLSVTHSQHLEACLAAVRALDALALESALVDAALKLSIPALLDELVCGLMRCIGHEWREGRLRVCHEHMATAQLRSFLGNMVNASITTPTGPRLLVTTPRGQCHELGALIVAVTAAQGGWHPLYLGPDIPSDEIAYAVTEGQMGTVALSISYPGDDPKLPDTLRRLRRQLPNSVLLLAGGAAAFAYRPVLDEIGALQPADFKALRQVLDKIRQN